MDVVTSHHVDASECDAEGFYDYHYEYDIYRFSRGGRTFVARAYVDEPERAAFVSRQERGQSCLLGPMDLTDPLLAEAAAYLHAAGKTSLERLSERDGYVPLWLAHRA
ncbi:hypothetical protein [Bosea beijingensis]